MKKVFALIATLLVASLALAGCGGTDTASSGAAQKNTSGMKTLKVGATAVPHAEILEVVKPLLEKRASIWKLSNSTTTFSRIWPSTTKNSMLISSSMSRISKTSWKSIKK